MRKVKLTVECRIPSWNFCNYDGFTKDDRYSKELCRFCVKKRDGYYCTMHDKCLAADKNFVQKCPACIEASAGFATTVVDEPKHGPIVDPKTLIKESVELYAKTVQDLVKQGYPQALAEKVALEYVTK